jgi:hypothetical protein
VLEALQEETEGSFHLGGMKGKKVFVADYSVIGY